MSRLQGQTILITEDQWIILHALESVLTDAGARVITAGDCEKAMSIINTERIDAGLLDYQLGDRDCTELSATLQARGIPFVILSGSGTAAKVEGASAHLAKPCPETMLVQTMVAVLKAAMPGASEQSNRDKSAAAQW